MSWKPPKSLWRYGSTGATAAAGAGSARTVPTVSTVAKTLRTRGRLAGDGGLPLQVQLRPHAHRMQPLVGVLEVGRVAHRASEASRRADRRPDVEVEGQRAQRGQLHRTPPAADLRAPALAARAAQRL